MDFNEFVRRGQAAQEAVDRLTAKAKEPIMTRQQAIEWALSHQDDDLDQAELEAAFTALYGQPPDEQDRAEGLWSHVCAATF